MKIAVVHGLLSRKSYCCARLCISVQENKPLYERVRALQRVEGLIQKPHEWTDSDEHR